MHQIHILYYYFFFLGFVCVCMYVGEDSFAKGNYYQGAEINLLL